LTITKDYAAGVFIFISIMQSFYSKELCIADTVNKHRGSR